MKVTEAGSCEEHKSSMDRKEEKEDKLDLQARTPMHT